MLPVPGWLCTRISPQRWSVISRARARPRPVPLERDESLELVNWRVAILIAGLLALAGFLILYMNVLMRDGVK